jgi:DNA-binding MarR family transcriptional regulator
MITRISNFVAARRRAGLSDDTLSILLRVRALGACSNRDLSTLCGINPLTLPRHTTSMVHSGWLLKTPGQADGREVVFVLSEPGGMLADRLLRILAPL